MIVRELDENIMWSDNWWIEGSNAWFIPGERNSLFYVDLKNNKVSFLNDLPINEKDAFRKYPRCIKCNNKIYCLPTYEKNILVYDLVYQEWKKIEISGGLTDNLLIIDYQIFEKKLYCVAKGIKKIIILDIDSDMIVEMHDIEKDYDSKTLGKSIFTDHYIYISSTLKFQMYEFNLLTGEIKTFELDKVNDRIQTISFDGNTFWLTGQYGIIYNWKKEKNEIVNYNGIPDCFGEYNYSNIFNNYINYNPYRYEFPPFLESVNTEKHVWFIPYKTNYILYFDKNRKVISEFYIDNESLTNQIEVNNQFMKAIFLLLYVREKQYLGIYSLKNKRIIEIDTKQMKYHILQFELNDNMNRILSNTIFAEHKKMDQRMFRLFLGKSINKVENSKVGNYIYQFIKGDKNE